MGLRTDKKRSRIRELRELEMFAYCSDKELVAIDRLMTGAVVNPGEVLAREGFVGLEFVVIEQGEARVTRGGHEVAVLGPGAFFGEMALLSLVRRSATVTATAPMVVDILTRGEFSSLLHAAPSLREHIIGVADERRRRNEDAETLVTTFSAVATSY